MTGGKREASSAMRAFPKSRWSWAQLLRAEATFELVLSLRCGYLTTSENVMFVRTSSSW